MTFTAKKTIQPSVIDSDNVETSYQTYAITQTCSSSKDYMFVLPANGTYYTPPMVDDYMSGIELISDQPINFGVFGSTGNTKFLFSGCKNFIFNSTGIGNTTGANTWQLMQSTGATAANVTWRVYSTT